MTNYGTPKISKEDYYVVTVKNRFTKKELLREIVKDINEVYKIQDKYLFKFWVNVEIV